MWQVLPWRYRRGSTTITEDCTAHFECQLPPGITGLSSGIWLKFHCLWSFKFYCLWSFLVHISPTPHLPFNFIAFLSVLTIRMVLIFWMRLCVNWCIHVQGIWIVSLMGEFLWELWAINIYLYNSRDQIKCM